MSVVKDYSDVFIADICPLRFQLERNPYTTTEPEAQGPVVCVTMIQSALLYVDCKFYGPHACTLLIKQSTCHESTVRSLSFCQAVNFATKTKGGYKVPSIPAFIKMSLWLCSVSLTHVMSSATSPYDKVDKVPVVTPSMDVRS